MSYELYVPIAGHCPMGCGETLRVDIQDHYLDGRPRQIICGDPGCARPTAAAAILADAESEHIVNFTRAGFSIVHPLRERLEGALHDCDVHTEVAHMAGPPVTPGMYRGRRDADGTLSWEAIA